MAYPGRLTTLVSDFGRSEGYISEVVEEVRRYLHPIADSLLQEFDHSRIVPLLPVWASAFTAMGCPLNNLVGLVDGTFRKFCRPGADGYNGIAQRAQWSGHKRAHGMNYQGLLSPEGIILEMRGPYAGRTNDKRMLSWSGLMGRMARYFVCAGRFFCIFGDRGYTFGHPLLQVSSLNS